MDKRGENKKRWSSVEFLMFSNRSNDEDDDDDWANLCTVSLSSYWFLFFSSIPLLLPFPFSTPTPLDSLPLVLDFFLFLFLPYSPWKITLEPFANIKRRLHDSEEKERVERNRREKSEWRQAIRIKRLEHHMMMMISLPLPPLFLTLPLPFSSSLFYSWMSEWEFLLCDFHLTECLSWTAPLMILFLLLLVPAVILSPDFQFCSSFRHSRQRISGYYSIGCWDRFEGCELDSFSLFLCFILSDDLISQIMECGAYGLQDDDGDVNDDCKDSVRIMMMMWSDELLWTGGKEKKSHSGRRQLFLHLSPFCYSRGEDHSRWSLGIWCELFSDAATLDSFFCSSLHVLNREVKHDAQYVMWSSSSSSWWWWKFEEVEHRERMRRVEMREG